MKSTRTILACGALILMLAMGVRQTMGLLLPPMTLANGWTRDEFAFAIALQNLLWGAFVPFTGAIADRFGAGRVLVLSGITYVLGLILMSQSATPLAFGLSGGLLIGLALSGTTFGVVMGVVAKLAPPEKRSVALGIVGAGGSFGQFAMVPYGQALISGLGWYAALFVLAATQRRPTERTKRWARRSARRWGSAASISFSGATSSAACTRPSSRCTCPAMCRMRNFRRWWA